MYDIIYIFCLLIFTIGSVGGQEAVLLKDLSAITLYHGKMTTGRRSSPVPQLTCTGGTARCDQFTPKVVQCYNRGSDGYDVQWECKTDMDNAYKFGTINVNCEGYSSRDDPYVLRGSCGLEYTLDLTKEGYQQNRGGHDYYGGSHQSHYKGRQSTWLGDVILYLIMGLVVYAFYVTCLGNGDHRGAPGAGRGGGGGGGGSGGGGGAGTNRPPPYGFRHQPSNNDDSCGQGNSGSNNSGGGFWSGAMAGGLLGYLMGGRGGSGYGSGYGGYGGYGSPRQSMWGAGGQSYFGGGGGSGGLFSGGSGGGGLFSGGGGGSRSASGFGGSSRR